MEQEIMPDQKHLKLITSYRQNPENYASGIAGDIRFTGANSMIEAMADCLSDYAKRIDSLENECEDWADKVDVLRTKNDEQSKLMQKVYDLIVGIQSPFV